MGTNSGKKSADLKAGLDKLLESLGYRSLKCFASFLNKYYKMTDFKLFVENMKIINSKQKVALVSLFYALYS